LTPQQAHRLHVFHYWAQQSSPWIRQCTAVSRQLLVTHHLGLVGHVIPSIINTGALEYDDLFQEGVIHLITAVDKFDPMRGFAFSTYALVVIKRGLCALMRSPKVRIAVGMRCTAFFVPFEEQASPMSVDGGISEIEWRLTMRQALAHLSHFDREVAELKYFHGMQKEEIASTLLVDVQSIVAASRRVAREPAPSMLLHLHSSPTLRDDSFPCTRHADRTFSLSSAIPAFRPHCGAERSTASICD
jgi:RNA polymerase sigma factor (sigma-70 family)